MKKQINLENVTILDLLYLLTKKYNGKPALQIKEKAGIRSLSYDELRENSVGVSSFIIEKDIREGTPIAILSENRPEWAVALFGIISAACVTVPIDAKLSLREILFILNDSKAECLFLSKKFLDQIVSHRHKLAHVKYLVCFDAPHGQDVLYIYDLKWQKGKQRNRPQAVRPENSVIIVYTSGTTGVAKGVELSYRNLLFEAMALYELIQFTTEDSFVSILPLNHMLEITGGLIAPLYGGSTVTYSETLKPTHLIQLMREGNATGMICVPLVLKMFYNGILKEIDKLPFYKRKIFRILFAVSKFFLKFDLRLGRLLFRGVHKKFGRNFKYFVSGGAALDVQLEQDFDALGFTILQGYGLTETSPVVAVNTPKRRKYGSVGSPLGGVEVKILKNSETDWEGQILVKGPNVMKGYYNNTRKTGEVIKDGWFYTGDIGYIDDDGFLFISGRAKNLIVLGAGKKVFPEEVEQAMNESPYIKEMCVLGIKATEGLKKGTEQVYAVIVPDVDRLSEQEKADETAIRQRVSGELARLSQNLAEYKRISDFMLYFDELPKTSTRKIKRKEVATLIENIEKDRGAEVGGEFLESMEFKEDETSYLYSDLGIDSLQKVELICSIEKRLQANISDQIAYEIATFKDLVRFVKEYKEGRRDLADDLGADVRGILKKNRIFYLSRLFTVIILKFFFKTYLKVKVRGGRNIPRQGSFIIAANHCSHLDFPILFSSLPLGKTVDVVAPAAADYFYKNRFRKILIEMSFNTFAFERFGNFVRGLHICRELLKRGKSIILFPEGTRSKEKVMADFKPGIGALSCELQVPILPVYIRGTSQALPKGKFLIKSQAVRVIIGEPVPPGQVKGDYNLYKQITQEVKERIVKLRDS